MSDFWSYQSDGKALRLFSRGEDVLDILLAADVYYVRLEVDKEKAREIASQLLQWAGSDDPEWGPLIPWHGGECPVSSEERLGDRIQAVLISAQGTLITSTQPAHHEFCHTPPFRPVIAYRVRKRPPEPVEEWVPLTVVAERQAVDIEILMRDGKAVYARMAQEGE